MGNMRTFHVIVIGLFAAAGLIGLIMFAIFKGFGQQANPYGNKVVIWGTLDDAPFVQTLGDIQFKDDNFKVVSYVQKDARTFGQDLTNALAEGKGPDLVIMPEEMLVTNRGKIAPILYDKYPLRTFKDTYIDGAEVFALQDGIYAIPIAVDPLIMYWNKDVFATKGLANPPRTWDELSNSTVPKIVERDFSFNVTRAALAFGEYANVQNAKAVLTMLFMQAGSQMVTDAGSRFMVVMNDGTGDRGLPPADAGLTFYTQFSNPSKNLYTWNRSLRHDRDMFLAGDLAMYFGFASEVQEIRDGNPNFNFDVAEVPQGAEARLKKGYGTIYGIAVMKNAAYRQGASLALAKIVSQVQTEKYAHDLGFGPVYRASYQSGTDQDPFLAVVKNASLVARGWLDPNPTASDNIFKQMVEDYTSGRIDLNSAITDAEGRLRQLLGG